MQQKKAKHLSSILLIIFILSPLYIRAQDNHDIEVFDRELESTVFVPKGQWVAGVGVNYSQSSQNKYQFLIVEGISGDTYSFKLTPMACYIFRNDMGVGGKFAYSRALTKLENADVVMDSENNYNISNLYRLSNTFSGMAILRNYFSIGHSRRFGFFNEIQLQLGGGQSKLMKGKHTNLTGAFESNFHFDIGLAPGIVAFLNDYSALEVNVGVLGYSYSHTKQLNDQIYVSYRDSQRANFRINLFSITFGVAFYI